jgi:hypothetical protein
MHQRWDGSPNIPTPGRDIVRSLMPPAIGYSGLSAVIITCGTEKSSAFDTAGRAYHRLSFQG